MSSLYMLDVSLTVSGCFETELARDSGLVGRDSEMKYYSPTFILSTEVEMKIEEE